VSAIASPRAPELTSLAFRKLLDSDRAASTTQRLLGRKATELRGTPIARNAAMRILVSALFACAVLGCSDWSPPFSPVGSCAKLGCANTEGSVSLRLVDSAGQPIVEGDVRSTRPDEQVVCADAVDGGAVDGGASDDGASDGSAVDGGAGDARCESWRVSAFSPPLTVLTSAPGYVTTTATLAVTPVERCCGPRFTAQDQTVTLQHN
jgi:hypothetical protein